MDLFEIYKSLWKLAQSAAAFVHYYTWPSLEPPEPAHDEMGATGF
jgi:hypothetical protein